MAGARKYIRIPHKDLPDLFYLDGKDGQDGKNVYFLRYRISNEAGTSLSKWSQEFEVPSGITASKFLSAGVYKATGTITTTGGLVDASWNITRLIQEKVLFQNKFHVYLRTYTQGGSPEEWVFAQEVSTTSFKTKLPATVDQENADIAVLVPTYRGLDADISLGTDSPMDLFPESVVWSFIANEES